RGRVVGRLPGLSTRLAGASRRPDGSNGDRGRRARRRPHPGGDKDGYSPLLAGVLDRRSCYIRLDLDRNGIASSAILPSTFQDGISLLGFAMIEPPSYTAGASLKNQNHLHETYP